MYIARVISYDTHGCDGAAACVRLRRGRAATRLYAQAHPVVEVKGARKTNNKV